MQAYLVIHIFFFFGQLHGVNPIKEKPGNLTILLSLHFTSSSLMALYIILCIGVIQLRISSPLQYHIQTVLVPLSYNRTLSIYMPQAGFDPPKQSAAQVLKQSRRSTFKPPRLDWSFINWSQNGVFGPLMSTSVHNLKNQLWHFSGIKYV